MLTANGRIDQTVIEEPAINDEMADDEMSDGEMSDEVDEPFDPDAIRACEYWRCGELFEQRTVNQIFCRKACRSRQRKWERAQDRKQRRETARADRAAAKAGRSSKSTDR